MSVKAKNTQIRIYLPKPAVNSNVSDNPAMPNPEPKAKNSVKVCKPENSENRLRRMKILKNFLTHKKTSELKGNKRSD